jgi:hypothetical protein
MRDCTQNTRQPRQPTRPDTRPDTRPQTRPDTRPQTRPEARGPTPPSIGRARTVVAAALAGILLSATAGAARADEVASTPKGTIGGGLLGGEVVTIVESLAGAHSPWWYGVGFVVGAGGGATGGFFIDKGSSNGEASMYLLAGGLALVIPALVLTLNATRYQGSEGATEDKPPVGAPIANPGAPGGSVITPDGVSPPPSAPTPPPPPAPTPPSSLLDIQMDPRGHGGAAGLRLGVPVPDVRPMYSIREQKEYGLPQHTEVHMPLLSVTF